MHDAIALANLLYALPSNTASDIKQTFSEYHAERYPPAVASFEGSQVISKIRNKGLTGILTLYIARYMPAWLWTMILGNIVKNRPYLGFLPGAQDTGSVQPAVSASSEKARALFEKRSGAAASV